MRNTEKKVENKLEKNLSVEIFDVLIIGGGVSGMTAAIYAKRAGKKVAIIEKMALGGQLSELSKIQNFPSQAEIDGFTLAEMFKKQVKSLEIEVISDEIVSASLTGENKSLSGKKADYQAKSIIIAVGMGYNAAGIGEDEFLGRGASFCAVCDGNFFRKKTVGVVSKNGSGFKDAKYLSKLAEKVIMFDCGDMSVLEKSNPIENIEIISNANVEKLLGEEILSEVEVKIGGEMKKFALDGLFVCLGKKPATALFEHQIKLDSRGFVITDEKMMSSVPGVFAVGDARATVLRQIVTACADGAIAGTMA